ncbi:MAG: DEAD/DEAH box helicase [Myxococcales bacterium]|nr:DEAD/DEAH box helicase [Myxococcales bacterium]
MEFSDYDLDPRLVEAVAALGFETPTPIQDACIPPLLEGRDVLGGARTGSGKTAAFGLPLLHAMREHPKQVGAVVLAPTRELALQVTDAFRDFSKGLPVRIVCIYGGVPYHKQLDALKRGAQVVVGTPGRVLDLVDRGALPLDAVRWLVLDEADEMLNMGFLEDVERLLAGLPEERQIALFSATMPDPIRAVAQRFLSDPVELAVEGRAMTVDHIEQMWIRVPRRHKVDALVRVLSAEPRGTTLVFVRTRKGCAEVADELARRGLSVDALHGDLSQSARERVLTRLRSRHLDIVAATDVAARGIDVAHITHVINFDLPDEAEGYTHRIGRTGRAGREGVAISFVTPGEQRKIKAFGRATGSPIPQVNVPSDAAIQRRRTEALANSVRAAMSEDLQAERALIESMDEDPVALAAAALRLVAAAQGLPLGEGEASEEAPPWARPRDRDRRGPERSRSHPPREVNGERGGPSRPQEGFDDVNEVQLFLPAGKQQGVRPQDLVGALASEGGVSGSDIGRIDVKDRVSFVGMSRAAAEQVLSRVDQVQLRGRTAPVLLARPRKGGGA